MIDKNDPRLTAFVLGELDEQEAQSIREAIAESAELKQAVDEIRATTEVLVQQFAQEPAASLTDQQRANILAGAEDATEKKVDVAPETYSTSSQRRWAIAALVAGITFVLGSILYQSVDWSGNDPVAKDSTTRVVKKLKSDSDTSRSGDDKKVESKSEDRLDSQNGVAGKSTLPNLEVTESNDKNTDDVVRYLDELEQSVHDSPSQSAENGEKQEDNRVQERFKNSDVFESGDFEDELVDINDGRIGVFGGAVGGVDVDRDSKFRNINGRDPNSSNAEYGGGTGGGGLGGGGRGGGGGGVGGRQNVDRGRPDLSEETEEDLPAKLDERSPADSKPNQDSDSNSSQNFESRAELESRMDRAMGRIVRRVDPTNSKDVTIEPAGEDKIKVLVDGKPEDEISLGYLLQLEDEAEDEDADEEEKQFEQQIDFELLEREISRKLVARNKVIAEARKSWKRVKATANTSRLMIGDKDELAMQGLQVNVQVDGFRARVLIDCFYYNDRQQQLEGNFKLRLPDDASLYYFAFGQSSHEFVPQGQLSEKEFFQPRDGTQFVSLQPDEIARERAPAWESVKEARMVPREKAALAYTQTVRRKVDPALVEWSGAGVFAARVFPLMPQKLHRIVIGYDVSLTKTEDGLRYRLDLPEELGQCKVNLNVTSMPGSEVSVTPAVKPKGDADEYLYTFTNTKLGDSRSIELDVTTDGPVLLQSKSADEGEFWATQITPELPKEIANTNSHAVFLLDTSLSSNPDKFNIWLKLLRETLDRNRDSVKQFSVVMFNVESYFWRNEYVENTPENVTQLLADCEQLALEGATDLYSATDLIASTPWITAEQQTPDVFLLSDGAANWGETNLRLIQDRMANANLGSLFAYQTGLTGTAINGLRFLADRTGGAVFGVASEDEIARAATAHRNRPWRIKSLAMAGGTDVMTAGRVSWVYPGQTLTLVGRGEVEGGLEMVVSQGDVEKTIKTEFADTVESSLASRMYGYVSVGQLESLGTHIEDVAAAYARHFRITGRTCSLLMLETEADYERFNIVPQEDLFVIKTRNADELVQKTVEEKKAELVSPKVRLVNWIHKLENMPGVTFEVPTALELAMDKIEVKAISAPLACKRRLKTDLGDDYLKALSKEKLDYNVVLAESQKRGLGSAPDAIKTLSSLIEQNPGDLTLARDIAFVAMELDEPAQAYGLLRRVALSRPYEPTIYPALGKCLSQLGQADMAVVFYEVAMEAQFQNRGQDYRRIVAAEYMHLLRKIESEAVESNIKDYAAIRLASLDEKVDFGEKDIVITMMWNTDQSDVDLHVIEPNGEDCHYGHRQTKSGGQITRDVTDGFGPEMYTLGDAPDGKYRVKVNYFGANSNRTNMRSKVYLTIYQNYGRADETVTFKSVDLLKAGDLQEVHTIGIR